MFPPSPLYGYCCCHSGECTEYESDSSILLRIFYSELHITIQFSLPGHTFSTRWNRPSKVINCFFLFNSSLRFNFCSLFLSWDFPLSMFEFSWMRIQHVLMPIQGALVAFDHAPYNHQALVCVPSKRALHTSGRTSQLATNNVSRCGDTGVFNAITILRILLDGIPTTSLSVEEPTQKARGTFNQRVEEQAPSEPQR